MSNRLTFSLASLTLIFALAFAAMPAMAADGGPTPTITEYSGLIDPNTAASATNVAHEQERDDFRLLVTFDALVTGTIAASDFTVNVAEAVGKVAEVASTTGIGTITAITTGPNANKSYMVEVNLDTTASSSHTAGDYSFGYISFALNENVVTGNQAGHATNGIQNVRSAALELTSQLPKNNNWTVTAALDPTDLPNIASGKLNIATANGENTFNLKFTFSGGSGAIPTLAAGQIQVKKEDGTAITTLQVGAPSAVGLVSTVTFTGPTAEADAIAVPIFIGVNPLWTNVAPSGGLRIPAAAPVTPPTPDPINPTVDISLVGMVDEAANTFEVKFTFAEADVTGDDTAAPVPAMFTDGNINIQKQQADPTDPTMMVMVPSDAYVQGNIISIGGGTSWLATINYRLDPLPLYVGLTGIDVSATTISGAAPGADDPSSLKIGEDPPTGAAPMQPAAPTAMENAANDLIIDVSWTAPADGGSAITGYTVKKYSGTTLVKTFPDDDPNTTAITGTSYSIGPVPEADRGMSFTFTVTAMNAIGSSMESAMSAAYMVPEATPENAAPVVAISTEVPAIAQTVSFTIEYTATDAEDADDTLNVTAAITNPPAGYTLDTSVDDEVTIMQAKGSYAANIEVTITATDSAGATGSAMATVIFKELPADPDPVMPGAPVLSAVPGDKRVTLNWTTPTGTIASYQYSLNEGLVWIDVPNSTAATRTHTVTTHADGTTLLANGQSYSFVVRAINAEHMGPSSNRIVATPQAAVPVTDTTPPTVTVIRATPNPINCETGSTLAFGFSEALGTGETVAATELTVSAGWKAMADGGAVKIVPMGDGSEIGVTTVSVSVNAGAVKDVAGNGNTASAATMFTVGPVLTIPAGGYIVVIRPEHMYTTHLRDPLYIGSTGVRAPVVDIQTWECMPDLTIFFGRSVPAIGGGAIVIKEADGPMGHDPGGTLADIAKGSVGLSEIMWASDEGVAHGGIPSGGRSNLDQTRDQWIELHNRNNTAVKVTLFARPTNSALTTENDELDRVSNYNINNVWAPPGQSGNSELGIDFVSMQRGKHDNKGLAPNQAAGYAHGDWNGIHSNRWSASTISYLTRPAGLRNTGQLAADNLLYDFLGTPGRNNKPGVSTPIRRTNVPKNTIVFNEIANRRDQTLEWIELKNVSDAEVNLKKYQISLATATGTDHAFYTFPDNDNIKLAAGEILLLLDTDPRDNDDHPIAVAFNRDGGNDQGLGIGPNAIKYKVANFREGGLPDNGNFVLYLRNRNDRLKSREGIIDLIGWSDKLADAANHTKVWPLQVFGDPDTRNKIELEKVHRRQHRIDPDKNTHGDDKDEHQALRDVGYTGVGYKRHAQRIAAHGGTPGYEDIRKNENPQITAPGTLTISEIMYDQGDGQYPQWIEIYNSSKTEAVNLHAGDHGWRLIIENFDDGEIPVKRLSGTLNFRSSDVQTILPQQTVIVASTRARNSGSAFFDTRVVFPATRVFSVWDDARGELDMKRSTDPILSEMGFYIELVDGKNNFVDGVGNLVKSPNRRAAQDIVWELSAVAGGMMEMEDDGRSSILRRYREYKDGKLVGAYTAAQVEMMGVEAAGWISAHVTDFLDVRQTWFGHADDYGSPGITGGRVLPVELSKFRPERLDDGTIVIRWITQSELNNAGFNILRSEKAEGEFKQINTKLIAGHGTTSERHTYTFTDTSAKPNVVYYYQIQDVSLDGKVQTLRMSRLKGHISPAGKATTTWGELKALQ